jgi:hypothetical protein
MDSTYTVYKRDDQSDVVDSVETVRLERGDQDAVISLYVNIFLNIGKFHYSL